MAYLGEVQSIDFTGSGEPLLNPHLFDWLTEAGNHGCQTGFLTNGLLLDNGAIGRLLEAAPEWIGFSVDAAEKELYERIRRGSDFGHDLVKFNEALDQAVQSMGAAPPGCRICHYLYGI